MIARNEYHVNNYLNEKRSNAGAAHRAGCSGPTAVLHLEFRRRVAFLAGLASNYADRKSL